jgi:hypothetical protein
MAGVPKYSQFSYQANTDKPICFMELREKSHVLQICVIRNPCTGIRYDEFYTESTA